MKSRFLTILVLVVLLFGTYQPAAGMPPTDHQQWVLSYKVENNWSMNSLEVFKDQLYASSSPTNGTGAIVFRTRDGIQWSQVSQPAFGQLPNLPGPSWEFADYIYDVIVFQGQLYAGYDQWIFNNDPPYEYQPGPAQIWRTSDGTDWEAVVPNGFGDANDEGVVSFFVFDGMLYAGVSNFIDGFKVFRSSNGVDWSQVAAGGLGFPDCKQITGFAAFKDQLFMTAEGWNTNGLMIPVMIWSTTDGASWIPITTDGFGDPNTVSPGGFAIFKNELYLGMEKLYDVDNQAGTAALWKTENGHDWKPVFQDGLGDQNTFKIDGAYPFEGGLYIIANNLSIGMGVWQSTDGQTWKQINDPGFGDKTNWASHWSDAVTKFKGELYFGTFNYDGVNNGAGQIWHWCKNCK